MKTFDPTSYPTLIQPLLVPLPFPELGPGKQNASARPLLAQLTPETLFPKLENRQAALGCISALWLLHDFLDESHTISQELSDWFGSYWHGIMHRREPDAWNSKYWFQKVGSNPVREQLKTEAPKEGYTYTTPINFIDFCETVRGQGVSEENLAQRIQLLEWQLLFAWCFTKASDATA